MTTQFRIEKGSLGEMQVPCDALYGVQTVRATQDSPIIHLRTHPAVIRSLGMIKKACATVNHECGHLDDERTGYIMAACDGIIQGKLDCWFITDVIQGGAGTSTNMNANEVVVNRATQLAGKALGVYDYIHPNDHVNFGRSTNDIFPTAGKLTALSLVGDLLEGLMPLQEIPLDKSIEFNDVIKLGRTHLQDVVPIRMGQEFHAFTTAIVRDIRRIKAAFSNLKSVNMGVTAVGIGINTDECYKRIYVRHLCDITQIELTSARDLIDGTRNVDPFVFAHASLKTFCISLSRMCNGLRLMASGPKTGLAEIVLPVRQPGSSIMPGKVNPIIPEVYNQVCFQIFGNDMIITKATEAGQMELNVFEPILFFNLFQSIDLLRNACHTLRIHAVVGIQINAEHCKEVMENSLGTTTALTPHIRYAQASRMAKLVLKENRKLKELILEDGPTGKDKLEEVPSIRGMTRAGIPGMYKKSKKQTGR